MAIWFNSEPVPCPPNLRWKGHYKMTDQNARYVLDNVNILVIDDNRHMANLVIEILHAPGAKNTCQAGAAAA